jgi:4'-phosphopantetheinyl transferase
VHVWRADLRELPEADLRRRAATTLEAHELARAERFHRPRDALRFMVGRTLLRHVVGSELGVAPERVRLRIGALGKPALERGGAMPDVRFNLAHSGDWVLVAVALGREVGVDVQRWQAGLDFRAMADRFFTPAEALALRRLSGTAALRAFYDGWVRKEACLKAAGRGLSGRLDDFEVSLRPHAPAGPVQAGGEGGLGASWHLSDLPTDDGYSAAVANEGDAARPDLRRWTGPPASTG